MADEIQVQSSLTIKADNVQYVGRPASFRADMTGRAGPTPGAVLISTAGTEVSLTALTTPGFVQFTNQDDTNYVEVGIREPATGYFYPFIELLPGESFVMRFSRNLLEEYQGTGTATSAATNQLWAKANSAELYLYVGAFEK